MYEANIDMVASNSFSEPVYSISKPWREIANLLTFILIEVC